MAGVTYGSLVAVVVDHDENWNDDDDDDDDVDDSFETGETKQCQWR